MLETGQKLNVNVEKLSLGGDGIARTDGMVLFIPYSAPEDDLEALITEQKKTFGRAIPSKIIKAGPGRVQAPCPHFFDPARANAHSVWCGGCNFQHLSYAAQLKAKAEFLRETIEKFAGLKPEILDPWGMEPDEGWRYRNKMQVPFAKVGGEVIAGFYSPGSHRVVAFKDCLIHSEAMVAVIRGIVKKMNEWSIDPYDQKTHRGWLRHVLVREQLDNRQLLVTFVTATEFFPKKDHWIQFLKKEHPRLAGICQNVNPEKTNVILGRKWRSLYGKDFLIENAGNLKLRVSASSFFQVNSKMAERLYGVARDWAGNGKILLDLYCGVGGIGLLCAKSFGQVLGADEVPSSITDAIHNGKLNYISNCRFFLKDTHDFLKELKLESSGTDVTVVLDPPRAGCAPEVLRHLIRLSPAKIIYVSCDPGTLARDLKILAVSGYKAQKVQPVDLFPQSSHIESVTLLTKP